MQIRCGSRHHQRICNVDKLKRVFQKSLDPYESLLNWRTRWLEVIACIGIVTHQSAHIKRRCKRSVELASVFHPVHTTIAAIGKAGCSYWYLCPQNDVNVLMSCIRICFWRVPAVGQDAPCAISNWQWFLKHAQEIVGIVQRTAFCIDFSGLWKLHCRFYLHAFVFFQWQYAVSA